MLADLRRRAALLAAALLLAAPVPALAQSAGDDQYEDPFAGQSEQSAPAPEPSPEPASTLRPAPRTPAALPAELPRTGLDVGPILALGAVLLASGVLLLRRRERG